MTRPLRALVVSHAHPALSLGGAEVASHNLHRGLNDLEGAESFYLARVGGAVRRHGATALMSLRQGEREILYHADDYDHFLMSSRATRELADDFARVLTNLKPDVVHVHHILGLGLEILPLIRRVLPKAALVVTLHEYLAICHNHGQMVKTGGGRLCQRATPADCNACFPEIPPAAFLRRERFAMGMLGQADHFVSPSRFLVDRFVSWGLDAQRFSVIENGLVTSDPAPPRPLAEGGRRARFGYFGQLTQFKGADILVDAVTRVPEAVWGEDASLSIFGGNLDFQPPAYRERLGALLEKAGPRVRMYGSYANPELPRLMGSVDWMVMPSTWWENSPVVIQEAFHHGRPIIASDIGGMAEKITDGVNGLHFRASSPQDLADRLCEALTNPGLWEKLRSGAPAVLSAQDCASRHLDLYRTILARRSGTPQRAGAKAHIA
jgi:glycosyltransferase involved in cell wall biosynthesis